MKQEEDITSVDRSAGFGDVAGLGRSLLAAMSDGVVRLSSDGCVVAYNDHTLNILRQSESKLSGVSFRDLFTISNQIRFDDAFAALVEPGQTATLKKIRLVIAEPKPIYVRLNMVKLSDSAGSGVLVVVRDISAELAARVEQKRLESQVNSAQKYESLGVLAGGIAHDFNNLLVGILGNAGLALLELDDKHAAVEAVMNIESAALRAAELTKEVLAYTGNRETIIESINLVELIHSMEHLLNIPCSQGTTLAFDLSDNLPPIDGDRQHLQQVVMNLVTNASEAMGTGRGGIEVRVEMAQVSRDELDTTVLGDGLPEGRYVRLEVKDTGCGMTDDMQSRLFDPFYTTKASGRGLGLAAVLGIIKSHRGTLSVKSEHGKGTVVRVFFPTGGLWDSAIDDEMPDLSAWQGRGTVLVADDEEGVRQVAKNTLEHYGFDVLTASDGQEAVDLFREHQSEVVAVLLDATMPRLSGEDALVQMRQINSEVRVLLSSGYSKQEAGDRFAGLGWTTFIQKPYRTADLAEQLFAMLGGH